MLIASVCLFFSCRKNGPGNTDTNASFDAKLIGDSINVNDTAFFQLSENPDVISFYSGEIGHQYVNKDRTVLTGGHLQMKFESRVGNQVADTLDVYVSNDFSGVYDSANVAAASWKRLTDKFIFPTPALPLLTYVPSGTGATFLTDISDSVISGQPFYLAYRYNILRQNNIEWTVRKVGMYNSFTDGTATSTVIDSSNNTSGGFVEVSMGEPTSRWTRSSTLYKCTNSVTSKVGAQHWYISRGLNPDAVSPDLPIVLKNISESALKSFSYVYTSPGTYKATFVASYVHLNYEIVIVKECVVVVP